MLSLNAVTADALIPENEKSKIKKWHNKKRMKLKYRHPDLVCLIAAGLEEF